MIFCLYSVRIKVAGVRFPAHLSRWGSGVLGGAAATVVFGSLFGSPGKGLFLLARYGEKVGVIWGVFGVCTFRGISVYLWAFAHSVGV